jgi:hypothetical protein
VDLDVGGKHRHQRLYMYMVVASASVCVAPLTSPGDGGAHGEGLRPRAVAPAPLAGPEAGLGEDLPCSLGQASTVGAMEWMVSEDVIT